ncbi:UNKNOWN [Stylonychia lemnae]|uniref:SPX domain-containing protein n=1 Tax=Stylonychia lemnae TaxID=5949 RepID=A0A078AKY5_STYLE|nr:UNKNOWN [Stylonychia lemnae]|eukprot:CDW83030.1 UNKNOWN [Stylonychia lemnae]
MTLRCMQELEQSHQARIEIDEMKRVQSQDEMKASDMLSGTIIGQIQNDAGEHSLIVIMENLTRIGQEIIEISKFVELNVTAIRKILKKFDKQFKGFAIALLDNQTLLRSHHQVARCVQDLKFIYNKRSAQEYKQKFNKSRTVDQSHNKSQNKSTAKIREPLLGSLKNGNDEDIAQFEGQQSTKKLLSSQNELKLVKSKLSILESTMSIIDEALISVKYSSIYAIKLNQRLKTSQYEKNLKVQSDYFKPLNVNKKVQRQRQQQIYNEGMAFKALIRSYSSPPQQMSFLVNIEMEPENMVALLFFLIGRLLAISSGCKFTFTTAFIINFYKLTEYFMILAMVLWIITFLLFAFTFHEPMKENANFANYQIEFSIKKLENGKQFLQNPFKQSEKFSFLMAAPITFPEHITRWIQQGDQIGDFQNANYIDHNAWIAI